MIIECQELEEQYAEISELVDQIAVHGGIDFFWVFLFEMKGGLPLLMLVRTFRNRGDVDFGCFPEGVEDIFFEGKQITYGDFRKIDHGKTGTLVRVHKEVVRRA